MKRPVSPTSVGSYDAGSDPRSQGYCVLVRGKISTVMYPEVESFRSKGMKLPFSPKGNDCQGVFLGLKFLESLG